MLRFGRHYATTKRIVMRPLQEVTVEMPAKTDIATSYHVRLVENSFLSFLFCLIFELLLNLFPSVSRLELELFEITDTFTLSMRSGYDYGGNALLGVS